MIKENSKIWYVIPTYWTEDVVGAFSSIYDHPTPIGSEKSTLLRTLTSLVAAFAKVPRGRGPILILVSAVQKEAAEKAERWVRELCAPLKADLDLFFAGEEVVNLLTKGGGKFASDEILFANGYRGYGDVRNLQLIVPAMMGAEWIYAIDDDEMVFAETIDRILWHVEKGMNPGVAGIYLNNEAGEYLVEASCEVGDVKNVLIDKGIYMNSTFLRLKAANQEGDLPISPLALGGNMLLSKEMFLQVSFDPLVPRGEDIDYVINAKARGFDFVFDGDLAILHKPPRHLESDEYGKMKADVIRFMYEKVKLEMFGLDVALFNDYPGRLLRDGFEEDALLALHELVTEEREAKFGSPEDVLKEAGLLAKRNFYLYQQFCEDWAARLMAWQADLALREEVLIRIG